MTNRLQPRAQIVPNPAALFNDVILFTPLAQGKVDVNLGDQLKTIDPLASNEKYYTFRATDEELRALLHQLKHHFREGRDETYVDGKLGATEKHLEDMRALVFNEDREVNVAAPVQKNKRVVITETYDEPTTTPPGSDQPINNERE